MPNRMTHIRHFLCEGCSLPIPLLETNLSEQGVPLRKLPTDAATLEVVCPHCKRADLYRTSATLLLAIEHIPNNTKLENTSLFQTTIGCAVANCGELYKVVVRIDKNTSSEKILEAIRHALVAASPRVRCPFGHPIDEQARLEPIEEWK